MSEYQHHMNGPAIEYRLREIEIDNKQDLATIARLHMELLDFGPMAGLGAFFIREICYRIQLQDGLLRVALYEVDHQPAGFVAYTPRSITFHRSSLSNHWVYVGAVLTLSILRDPRRLLRLLRAVRVVFSRRAEQELEQDPLGEVVCIGVRPAFLTPAFVRRSGLRIGEELVRHAASYLQRAGIRKMRMIVDADNKVALFFYHRLGARLEPYEQAGEPQVHVWFDLHHHFALPTLDYPSCWSFESHPMQHHASPPHDWASYWDGLEDRQRLFRIEANDYVQRLKCVLQLPPQARVLDFGSGFGLVAAALAPHVGELSVWDASANMRQRTRLNVAHRENIRFLDLTDASSLPYDGYFDLILVNSVVQYMSDNEFSAWLAQWQKWLAPDGRVVISDLIPCDYQPMLDLLAMLMFSARHGFLVQAVREGLREVRRYWRMRQAQPLGRFEPDNLRQRFAAVGLTVAFLPANLTFRRQRLTAVLSHAVQKSSLPT